MFVNVVYEAPSHVVRYCENCPLLYLNRILYLVKSDPLSNGATQLTSTLSPITSVVGLAGVNGTHAQRDSKTAESELVPNELVDVTTK